MSAKKLTVYSVNPSNMHKKPLATLTLHGGKVKADFSSPGFKREIEGGVMVRGKTYKLEDGPKFMDAVEQAYSRSSTIVVEPST